MRPHQPGSKPQVAELAAALPLADAEAAAALRRAEEFKGTLSAAMNVAEATKVAAEAITGAMSAQSGGSLVALKRVTTQGSDATVKYLTSDAVEAHFARYRLFFGRGPAPEEECSLEQMARHS